MKSTPIVPDVFVSLDIPPDATLDLDYTCAYFAWVFEKMPDVVIEVVSNRKGGEMARKMKKYALLHIPYYAVFDPFGYLKGMFLRCTRSMAEPTSRIKTFGWKKSV